jgi:hypothetical protein
MASALPDLPPELLLALDREIARRAEERAERLCQERLARGVYLLAGDPDEADLDERFGVRPVRRAG